MDNIPRKIAIVPDGNRRYSKKHALQVWQGHQEGVNKLNDLLDWCKDAGVRELTLWIFSTENFNRNQREIDFLMNTFRKQFEKLRDDNRFEREGIKVRFVGKLELFPEDIQKEMEDLMERTKKHGNFTLNFAAAYGGRAEIVDTAKKVAKLVKEGKLKEDDINEEVFADNLYMKDEPDLIIRTSEKRLSGFLPYQGAYSEIIFVEDKLWPEFNKEDFMDCIKAYSDRQRRFGR